MDSITQAALGAAMGQAVLGKKMGNRAMLIGAIAGTIPDLDVFSRFFLSHEVYALIYHRGLTHSILFTLLVPPLLAWLSLWYYKQKLHEKKGVQVVWAVWWAVFYAIIILGISVGAFYSQSLIVFGILGILALGTAPVYKSLGNNIKNRESLEYDPSFKNWTLMYFLAILTHWLIDACTAYGTQIFEPFSNYRVAFNNISILDPTYTIPLLLGLGFAFFAKNSIAKQNWNYVGLAISTLYMASTFYSKSVMNQVVENSLKEQNIAYNDYITYPTILNTILWQTTVETDSAYYYGTYSLLDSEPKIKFLKLPKNHNYIEKQKDNEYIGILLWFANGYYNVIKTKEGELVFNNLRFGLMMTSENSILSVDDKYIFRFLILEKDGKLDVEEYRDFDKINAGDMAAALWKRIKGI